MASTNKAGCACGAVQLEITGDPTVQAYCHCSSCRGWLGAPIHAASLWPTPNVKVTKGADKLGLWIATWLGRSDGRSAVFHGGAHVEQRRGKSRYLVRNDGELTDAPGRLGPESLAALFAPTAAVWPRPDRGRLPHTPGWPFLLSSS